ncbi:hypothetical protein DFJ73DRAFT_860472 [Zopfochytrium polystomum]|nr:hypothetical protein DFJ73DRAFT_860472 [Zopfochytrium polystomum]
MHIRPNTPTASVHQNAQRRHFDDPDRNERRGRMLKEDLGNRRHDSSTYDFDYKLTFQLDSPSFKEPRFVMPKLPPNADLEKPATHSPPTQSEVDRFLYVSLYQASFNHGVSGAHTGATVQPRGPESTSLYQDSFSDPRHLSNEMRLLDNRSNRTPFSKKEHTLVNASKGVSKLLHLVDEPLPETSYKHDYLTEHAPVLAGAPPSLAPVTHPLETRTIVKKAFKYRRH